MTVEETGRIDIVARRPDGKLLLVVSDHLGWEHPERHKRVLQAKIESYVAYVLSQEFVDQYPNVSPTDVVILVAGRFPPKGADAGFVEAMTQRLAEHGIELAFENVRGATARSPEPREATSQRRGLAKSRKLRRSIRLRLSDAQVTRDVVVRRIRVAFATMGVAWAGTTLFWTARIIGAPGPPGALLHYLGGAPSTTLAILICGYWMTMRSRRPTLMVGLSLATQIAAAFALLLGWIGLVGMVLVFRKLDGAQEAPPSRREASSEAASPQGPQKVAATTRASAQTETRGRLLLELWSEAQFRERQAEHEPLCSRVDIPQTRTVLILQSEDGIAPLSKRQAESWSQEDALLFDSALENFIKDHRPSIEWTSLGSSHVAIITDDRADLARTHALAIGRHRDLCGPGGALFLMPGEFVVCCPVRDQGVVRNTLPNLLQAADVSDTDEDSFTHPVFWWHRGRFHEVGLAWADGKKEVRMPEEFWSMLPTLPEPRVEH